MAGGEDQFLLVSSYTEKLGHVCSPSVPQPTGITVFRRLPPAEGSGFGSLAEHARLEVCPSPSYICADRAGRRVFACGEVHGGDEEGNPVLSFALSEGKRALGGNTAEAGGSGACHLQLSLDEASLAVANYCGGSLALFSVSESGELKRTGFRQHEGAAMANPERQEKAHAHMALWAGGGRHLLVPDLGLDRVFSYEVAEGALTGARSELALPPGSGPRHLAFHPSGHWVYVLNELLSTVAVCSYNAESGALALLFEPVSTLPSGVPVGVDGKSFCAALRVSQDGRFLYASNRGHDSIAVFALPEDAGPLGAPLQWVSTMTGEDATTAVATWPPKACPRDFVLVGPEERWLIVANQDSDCLLVLERCPSTGRLSPTDCRASCPAPVCVLPLL